VLSKKKSKKLDADSATPVVFVVFDA